MTKVNLGRLASLTNAVSAINGILAQIETVLDTFLSRDGASPNTLTASLDANSNRILNLPAPASNNEPVRNGDYQAQLLSNVLTVPLSTGLGGTGSTTVSGARTNLGLGTSATLDVGTTANKIVQLDGSAKLPAVDGSQLTNIPAPSPTTGTGNWVKATDPTVTNPTFAAGTTAKPSYTLLSGSLLTTPAAGATEYDGVVFYKTASANNRGVAPNVQYVILTSARTFTNNTSAQAVFAGGGGPASGQITLPVGTYFFDTMIQITGLPSALAKTATLAFGGTATLSSVHGTMIDSVSTNVITPVTSSTFVSAFSLGTSPTAITFRVTGVFRVSVAGTVILNYTQGTNSTAAVVTADSYMSIYSVGGSSAAYVGNWS